MSIRSLLLALAASLSFSLVGCGGGGGSDSSEEVLISSHTPALLETREFEGMGYGVSLDVQLAGDLSTLEGKQVYLFVEVGGDVLQGQPQLQIDPEEGFAQIDLSNAPDENAAAGVHEGTVRISACLDSACHTQLKNSPLTVPYKVTIEPGLRLSTQAIEKDVAFGTKPTATRVAIELPQGATEWSVSSIMNYDGGYSVAKAADGSAAVDVVFTLKAPGSYTETFSVDTSAPSLDGSGRLETFQKAFTVTYTVREDPSVAPIAFDPAGANYSFPEGTSEQGNERFLLVYQPGTLSFMGAVYLSSPADAAGSPQVNDWIWDEGAPMNEYNVLPCDTVGPWLENCLPPGEYRGALRFRHTSPTGIRRDFPSPLTVSRHQD